MIFLPSTKTITKNGKSVTITVLANVALQSHDHNIAIDVPVISVTNNNIHEQLEKDKKDIVKRLAIECLSADRASGYQSWIEVGWCLHNIDPSEEMFQTWMEFSQKSHKAGENNINGLLRDWNRGWSRSQYEKCFTNRSLHMWAKEDNPKNTKKLWVKVSSTL